MRFNVIERLAGTTVTFTWVNSGQTASPIRSALYDRNDTLVSSTAGVSSGNGHYFALHYLPTSWAPSSADLGASPQSYRFAQEWIAVINANTYRDRQFVVARLPGVT